MSSREYLQDFFNERFSEKTIGRAGVERVRRYAAERIGVIDAKGEGYLDPSTQRDLSIKFHWGHNHRFADDLMLEGRMGDRHIRLLTRFMDEFGLERDLTGKRILDIGCWTGGAALLMAGLGATVVAIEEVRKYVETVNFLADVFNVGDRLACVPESLYEFLPKHADSFDVILYAGVIYHVTDPLLSLREVFGALKNGGRCFVETHGIDHPENMCRYEGPRFFHTAGGDLSRGGWNYFIPSSSCLQYWCLDAGFAEANIAPTDHESRLYGMARRDQFTDILRAGLSLRHVR